MKSFILITLILLCTACSSTKKDFYIDGSTAETTEKGINRVIKTLKPEEKSEFYAALLSIQFSGQKSLLDVFAVSTNIKFDYEGISTKIDGLNYYGVLEKAKESKFKPVSLDNLKFANE